MPGTYTHTTRTTGTTLTASIYNSDHQNHIDHLEPQYIDDYSTNLAAMQTVTDPGELGSESLPTTLGGELERIRYALQEVKTALNPNLARWYQTPQGLRWVNVRAYGATGDGTTDDYSACASAVAALSSGGVLYFPPGTYAMSHGLCIPYNNIIIRGAGKTLSTLKAISGITSTAGLLALGYNSDYTTAGASDLVVEDLGINGNDLSWCIKGISLTRCLVTRCRSENSLRAPAQFYSSTEVTVSYCHLEDSNASDQFGDGLYFGGCVRPRALFNYITDFKRIGIVTESNGGTMSSDALILGNTVTYGHDSTSPEANCGIWIEHTNGAVIADNKISNMYNSPGAAQPRGITVGPNFTQDGCFFHVHGNMIEDVYYGIAVNTTATGVYAHTVIESNVVRAGSTYASYTVGLHIGGGKYFTIKNNKFGPITFDAGNPGSTIMIDTGTDVDTIHIENNDVTGITHYASSGDFRTYSLNGHTVTNFRMVNQVARITMDFQGYTNVIFQNCKLTGDSTTYRPISATAYMLMANSSYTTVGGTAMITAYSGAQFQFVNCNFPTLKFAYQTTSSTASVIKFTGCYFGSGSYVEFDGVTNLFFDACLMEEYRAFASGGFLKGNATNNTAHIRVRNCDFFSSTNEIPFKIGSFQPTSLLTTGCTTTAAALGGGMIRGLGSLVGEGTGVVDVIATADLPAAGTSQNGRLLIENNGAGDRNLILYAGGERFRIDGGAAV